MRYMKAIGMNEFHNMDLICNITHAFDFILAKKENIVMDIHYFGGALEDIVKQLLEASAPE